MKLERIKIEKKRFLTLTVIFIIAGSILLVLSGIWVVS